MRSGLVLAALAALVAVAPAHAQTGLGEYTGAIHGHTSYSDGYPGTRPAVAYAHVKADGNDFFALTDHSDAFDVPIVVSEECLGSALPECLIADQVNPADSSRKWEATREQAEAATTPAFTGVRGFEWTSDRFGHVNVLFSRNHVNAKVDGGYATMATFYGWLTRPMSLGGGSDGLAIFNHPGDKALSESDPAYNWNDFAYEPAVDAQMVGIEVYNDRSDFASPGAHGAGPDGWYAHALDAGWHVGAVGAEDLGHRRGDDWGGPLEPKTVILAPDRSRESLRAALRARRFYAIRRPGYGLDFTVDGAPMGARLVRPPGATLAVEASARGPEALEVELVTSGGEVVAGGASLDVDHVLAEGEEWFYVRAVKAGTSTTVAYSSPVWVEAGDEPGRWLAGDLHVHTCYSHDVYCGPSDEPLEYEPGEAAADLAEHYDNAAFLAQNVFGGLVDDGAQAVTFGLEVGNRFAEASARGLDYLAITDHERVESSSDGGFGAAGVLGLPSYENSIRGHAQMHGARRTYPKTDVVAMRDALRADGGLLQVNHPVDGVGEPFTGCDDPDLRHWKYDYDFEPDTVEVYNPTSAIDGGEAYLECWLTRGVRMTATGGSDSHWAALAAAGAGVGAPTTFVFARGRSERAVLDAIDAGRTSISKRPPLEGGAPLLLEADADGDGSYEAMIGDEVPAGSAMRVRSASPSATGYVKVRANGRTLALDEDRLLPGGVVEFDAPADGGWVRANLLALPEAAVGVADCPGRGAAISPCTYDQLVLGLTSPIYLSDPPGPETSPTPTPSSTASPSATPTVGPPSPSPTAMPSPTPTAEPSPTIGPPSPSPSPSATPSPTPESSPTIGPPSPTASPTPSPTATPALSAEPSPSASPTPSGAASPAPSGVPSPAPEDAVLIGPPPAEPGRNLARVRVKAWSARHGKRPGLRFASEAVGDVHVSIRRAGIEWGAFKRRLAGRPIFMRLSRRVARTLEPGRYSVHAYLMDDAMRRGPTTFASFRIHRR